MFFAGVSLLRAAVCSFAVVVHPRRRRILPCFHQPLPKVGVEGWEIERLLCQVQRREVISGCWEYNLWTLSGSEQGRHSYMYIGHPLQVYNQGTFAARKAVFSRHGSLVLVSLGKIGGDSAGHQLGKNSWIVPGLFDGSV